MNQRVVRRLLVFALTFLLMPRGGMAAGYTMVRSFGYTKPGVMYPTGPLTLLDGTFYGASTYGGANDFGEVYRVSPEGEESTVYSFVGSPDGEFPSSVLIAIDGTLYGTTEDGGDAVACPGLSFISGCGTVFAVTPGGQESVVYTFHDGADAGGPDSLLGLGGMLYGTTAFGGAGNAGTVFGLTLGGTQTVLHSFGAPGDGSAPSSLIFTSGQFYGTTGQGGLVPSPPFCVFVGCGTVFRLAPTGQESVVYAFGTTNYDSIYPSSLIAVKGVLYGTSQAGVPQNQCGGQSGDADGCGTVFAVAGNGAETVLHAFSGADGEDPVSVLTYLNGTFYGETSSQGAYNSGTLYSITPSGVFSVLHAFGAGTDGRAPTGGLTNVNGVLYGITQRGGTLGVGTAFSYTP